MKVLLTKDVYKLGRAGDIKRVADGYGRNYLIPQGLAMLATPGALKQAERIRQKAGEHRAVLNEEMASVAEQLANLELTFAARASETGKLYGSITSQNIADAIREKTGCDIKRQQLDMQPLRMLGEHRIHIRLTMDLIPEIKMTVYREGEAEPNLFAAEEAAAESKAEAEMEAIETEAEAAQAGPVEAKVEAEPTEAEPAAEE